MTTNQEPMLRFFAPYDHLPEHLQEYGKLFADLAYRIVETLPSNSERTKALRTEALRKAPAFKLLFAH